MKPLTNNRKSIITKLTKIINSIEDDFELENLYADLSNKTGKNKYANKIRSRIESDYVSGKRIVCLTEDILFETDKYTVKPASLEWIRSILESDKDRHSIDLYIVTPRAKIDRNVDEMLHSLSVSCGENTDKSFLSDINFTYEIPQYNVFISPKNYIFQGKFPSYELLTTNEVWS